MNKLIKSLLVVAGIAVAGVASAQSPVDMAGICAGNAMMIKKIAEQSGPSYADLGNLAAQQFQRDYTRYGSQPGFSDAAKYSISQNSTLMQRVKIAGNCEKAGF